MRDSSRLQRDFRPWPRIPGFLLLGALASSCSGRASEPHPNLFYQSSQRAEVVRIASESGPSKNELSHLKTLDLARTVGPLMGWEGGRAQGLFRLGILMWIEPDGRLKKTGEAYGEIARSGIESITLPGRRAGEGFAPLPGQKVGWGRYLDAAGTLWNYAAAYDLLASPQAKQAGVTDEMLNAFYSKVADGGFAGFVDHLRGISKPGQTELKNAGNNWIARELAGVGLACLSFRDKFKAEPTGSKRRQDYEDGLRIVRKMSTAFLRAWTDPREKASYYYEGPHYLQYWAEMFIPFAHAHELAFPGESKELSLSADSPLMSLLRGQTLTIMPTRVTKAGSLWTNAPLDDSWIDPASAGNLALLAAAWGPQSERQTFLSVAKRAKISQSEVLVGNPILDQTLSTALPQLPLLTVSPYTGIATMRTGSEDDDLAVVLKNSRTLFTNDKKTGEFGPHLLAHTHSDTGEVVAYRDAEPILIDPGYGPGGYDAKGRTLYFSNWNRHNVLMLDGRETYGPGLRAMIEEKDNFVLPAFTTEPTGARITKSDKVSDGHGTMVYAEAQTAASKRTTILVDKETILVVDRLSVPARVKLAWWGNGSKETGSMEVPGGGSPAKEESIASVIGNASPTGPTAFFDPSGIGKFTRGQRVDTQISVYMPSTMRLEEAEGRYGPFWNPTNIPLTGMHVSSEKPVKFAVTLIEIRPKGQKFRLSAVMKDSGSGVVKISLLGGGNPVEYVVGADGTVSRN